MQIPRSTYLFISIIIFIFINPLYEDTSFHKVANLFSYSLIFIATNFSIKKRTILIKSLLILGVISQFAFFFIEQKHILISTFTISAIVFAIVTTLLILQIARTKNINLEVIFEAISGYLLIGIIATITNIIILAFNNNAILFEGSASLGDMIYYSFITLTTIGYGEIIPISPMARNISLITGISGQLYLTIIIALIIGKFSSTINQAK